MLNFSKIKIIFIYLTFFIVSAFCVLNFFQSEEYFFKKKINLGLDLQGGSYLLLEVDSSPLQKRHLQSKVIPLKKKLIENKINYKEFKINEKEINFEISQDDKKSFEEFFTDKKNNEINIFLDQYRSFELDFKFISYTRTNLYSHNSTTYKSVRHSILLKIRYFALVIYSSL